MFIPLWLIWTIVGALAAAILLLAYLKKLTW